MLKVAVDGAKTLVDMNGCFLVISRDMIMAISSVYSALKSESDIKAENFRKIIQKTIATEPIVWDMQHDPIEHKNRTDTDCAIDREMRLEPEDTVKFYIPRI